MWQRAYRLDRVQPPDVAGRLRACAEQDRDLVEAWTQGFVTDLGIHGAEQMAPLARHAFDTGGFHLWEHEGAPRAMAALVGETPRGARIGFVYTPPELRRRGYGAACTAAVSQHTLDAGKAFCCLNADLGNPAANSIYQRIGYRPVGDLREILFDPNPAGIAGTSRG
jgi:predicted GNAT family acetyltransferase